MKKALLVIVALSLLTLSIAALADTTVYSNDFEGSVGSEWSDTRTSVTPVGERHFLGQFWNDTVTLSLNSLAPHSQVGITFDLFVIGTWDGNGYDWEDADIWSLSTSDGSVLLKTTFSNNDGTDFNRQAYPGSYPGGDSPARTGAIENNTLGYRPTSTYPWGVRDSVYHLSYLVTSNTSSLDFIFQASQLQEILPDDENWGIDNVNVSITTVPEPSSILAACTILTPLGFVFRRRKK